MFPFSAVVNYNVHTELMPKALLYVHIWAQRIYSKGVGRDRERTGPILDGKIETSKKTGNTQQVGRTVQKKILHFHIMCINVYRI